jgi:hypothetical protein
LEGLASVKGRIEAFPCEKAKALTTWPCATALACDIRNLLEYNSIVWNPNFIGFIEVIESFRRSFIKGSSSVSLLPQCERIQIILNYAELQSTHHLRQKHSICLNLFMIQIDFCQTSFFEVLMCSMLPIPAAFAFSVIYSAA